MLSSSPLAAGTHTGLRRPALRKTHGGPARRKASAVVGLAAVLTMALAACSSAAPEAPAPITQQPTVTPSKTAPPEPVVPLVWPLTGVAAAELAERPAIAVKIENTSVARPQAGLEKADVVWETIVEFDVSRFIAVFHSQLPEEVGPVRSVRPMDPPVVAPLRGLLVYSGGQPGIVSLVVASGVQSISQDAGSGGLYRVSHRSAPHNVYGNPQAFLDQANPEHMASPSEQFVFADTAVRATAITAGTPAGSVAFRLSAASSPSWAWDAASGTWLRSEGSAPAMAASGDRISATNVVAITAPHVNTGFGAQGGAPVPTYELVGEGDALVATGGQTVPGRWKKTAQDAPMQLFTADGAPLLLAPGNTWVELVPLNKGTITVG